MISYLSQRPVLSLLTSLIGIALLVAAFVMNPFKAIPAGAATPFTCNTAGYGYPADPTTEPNKYTYNTIWTVDEWLRWDTNDADGSNANDKAFPIGPSGWLVCGKTRDAQSGNVSTFQEKWQLEQVRLASSRAANTSKGQAFNRSPFVSDGWQGKLETSNVSVQANGDDENFKGADDNNWSPLGLYGLLFTSSDALENATTFIPTKWTVSGTYE